MTEKQKIDIRRKNRQKQTAEIFTPDFLVNEMLDKLTKYGPEIWEKGKTFIDPACGNGNFLIEILKRKLNLKHNVLLSLRSIYGLDIMKDNIVECRLRLLSLISNYESIKKDHIRIVFQNIRWLSPTVYPRGTLDYDMSFRNNYNEQRISEWFEKIKTGQIDIDSFDVGEYRDAVIARDKNGKPSKTKTESVDFLGFYDY
jgi:hypothetical protein